MTPRILIIGITLVIVTLVSCSRDRSGGPGATPQPTLGSEAMTDLKNLLFADQSLEELLSMVEPTQTPPPDDPLSLFASSVAASRANKTDEAKNLLKQALASRDAESRIQLWAWKGLRTLGEQPPQEIADEVQGVVCELHNEKGVGTMAAYADGRARWLGGEGTAIVWEVPGSDAAINAHITKLLKSAEPLVDSAPLSETHQTAAPNLEHFRVSILTYRGIRTVEVYGPSIEQSQPIAAVLLASVDLLDALSAKSAETQKPSPR